MVVYLSRKTLVLGRGAGRQDCVSRGQSTFGSLLVFCSIICVKTLDKEIREIATFINTFWLHILLEAGLYKLMALPTQLAQ